MAIDLNDKTSNGNTLTNNGGAEVTTNLAFAGSSIAAQLESANNDFFSASGAGSLNITGAMTLEILVKFTTLPGVGSHASFFGKEGGTAANSPFLWTLQNSSGTYRFFFEKRDSADAYASCTVDWTPSTDTWYRLALTYNTDGSVKFYVDGSQQGTTQTGLGTSIQSATAVPLAIGTYSAASPALSLNGIVDDIRVWNVVRTQTELNNNKLVELVGNETGLAGYWPLESLNQSSASSSISSSPSSSSSASPSSSQSPSSSPSSSPSPSSSISSSISSSPSSSTSPSSSKSASPSSSTSASVSSSKSASPSASQSPSSSRSSSPSSSISASASSSVSASPSAGYQGYTKGNYAALPGNDNDLESAYTAQNETDVSSKNDVRVGQSGVLEYIIHQFKDFVGSNTSCQVEWEGQSSQAPSASTVYLQIYNQSTDSWETIDSDNASNADTDFTLIAEVADLTNYKDPSNVISCRVYQLSL